MKPFTPPPKKIFMIRLKFESSSNLSRSKVSLIRSKIYIKAINRTQSMFWETLTSVILFGHIDTTNQAHR